MSFPVFELRAHHDSAFGESKFARTKAKIVEELCPEFPEYSYSDIESTVERFAETCYRYGFKTRNQLTQCLRIILNASTSADSRNVVTRISEILWGQNVEAEVRLVNATQVLERCRG